jgi:outer membrane protein OmpA-like peptidoglycan-associated protein
VNRLTLRKSLIALLLAPLLACASASMSEPKGPARVIIESNRDYILQAPTFERGSATLGPTWRRYVVEDLATSIRSDPEMFVLVSAEGHAASDDPDPIALSTARAKAVLDALVSAGVAPERLRARGYGPHCPWSDEADKNRRVEFKVVRTKDGPTGAELGCANATRAGLGPE